MFVIVDYSVNNSGSLLNMINKAGFKAKISADISDLKAAKGIFLPGNGSFDSGMMALTKGNLKENLEECVLDEKIPLMGICLGMQLLSKGSEEGVSQGLGWLDAKVLKLQKTKQIKVPHMGWNDVFIKRNNILLADDTQPRFYFVHSFYIKCDNESDIILTSKHGIEFVAGIKKNNVFGVQFHPEKSHAFGLDLIKNFCSYCYAV